MCEKMVEHRTWEKTETTYSSVTRLSSSKGPGQGVFPAPRVEKKSSCLLLRNMSQLDDMVTVTTSITSSRLS